MNEQAQTGIRVTDVRTVAVPVLDQDRALAFYVGTLGFEKRMDAPMGPGMRWVEVAPPGATTTIALTASSESAASFSDGRGAGVDTGIRLVTSDAEGDHDRLRSQGVDVDPLLRWDGVPLMFVFRDRDGNSLVIVEGA
ncbi:MAG TPA: VOC family protein [Pseudonocardia sp.]|jgi:catechol 2,3-dioxygenase-like lactoylglutathione lyase family enzyme|nr:VOC family protein [Pseudonocardia sp.]